MSEKQSKNFSELRQRVSQAKPETLSYDEEIELQISPLEKIRYEENAKLADAIYDTFFNLIDQKLNLEKAENQIKSKFKELNPNQQAIIEEIIDNIKNSISKPNQKKFITYFFTAAKNEYGINPEDIDEKDINMTPLGAIVVRIQNPKIWKKFNIDNPHDISDVGAIFISYESSKKFIEKKSKDGSNINEQFRRTVYVNATPDYKKQYGDEEIENARHELFHELYHNYLFPDKDIDYENEFAFAFFLEFRDELVAYFLNQKEWEPNIEHYVSTVLINESNGEIDKFIREILKNSKPFIAEYTAVLQEIKRLRNINSKNFEEATKAALTAQDFKEIAYKLSKIK